MSTIDSAISEKKSVKNYLKSSLLGLLSPFSFLWETLYKLRRFSYNFGLIKKRKFNVPIISIGNITFGGTGKTPFSMWLAEYLATLDKKVMMDWPWLMTFTNEMFKRSMMNWIMT